MARMSHAYPQELRERAIRLVYESRDQYESEWKAIESVATKSGIGSTETLRKWIRKNRSRGWAAARGNHAGVG
jgi:transposase